LGNRKKSPWPNEQFDEVDWEHLDLAMKRKPNMYKIWRSKQNSSFCGTRVQVGRYSGIPGQDERCPNCGRRETAAHLLLCPSEDRTQLLIDNADELEKWLKKDSSTDQELAYWLPKYILMRGDKPFADMGAMSPRMKALAQSQDKIGYHNFMEGYICIHFYEIQNFHLAMSSSFLKIYLKNSPHNTLPMDILQLLSPRQEKWLPPQEEGRGDSSRTRVIGRTSSGRCPNQQPISTGN